MNDGGHGQLEPQSQRVRKAHNVPLTLKPSIKDTYKRKV